MLRRISKPATTTGAVTIVKYVRWCASAPSPKLDPKISLARAVSLVNPSMDYPATPAADITGPSDPRIMWREHWDVATKRPYYENLASHEVTFDIPADFPTRYGAYWVGQGHNVLDDFVLPKGTDSSASAKVSTTSGASEAESSTAQAVKIQMRQFSTTYTRRGISATPPPEGTPPSRLTMKQRIGLYGTAGLVLYLIIHNTLLACIFVTLYVFKVDLVSIARSYGYELKFLSGNKGTKKEQEESDQALTEEITNDPSLFATFITAVALCKLVVPFQLTITLALCPALAPRLNVLIQRWRARRGGLPPMSETPPV